MKKIVFFNGSPRSDGNTITILNAIAKSVRDCGGDVKFYNLLKMKFKSCQGCFACRFNDTCVIKDEITEAVNELKTADGVVIGSPIYMMQVCAPIKNLYDRFFPLTDIEFKPRFGIKKAVTVYSQGSDDPNAYESYFEYIASLFPMFGFKLIDNIVCPMGNDPARADNTREIMIRAYNAGIALMDDK